MADQYMTPEEFAALTVSQQCDVWMAADCGLIGWIELRKGMPRQYDREQVAALLAGEARG